jgi:iron-sulfur cluster repair protein YtfE (RIC family)
MDGMQEWAFPSTRIAEAIKIRPASLPVFESLGCDPWAEGDTTLESLCARCGKSTHDLVRELLELPVSDAASPWEEQPVCALIDYLTYQHRQLLYVDLPALRSLLEMPFGESSGAGLLGILMDSFHGFTERLRAHLQEEEDRLFPAILRNEFLLRHAGSGGKIQAIANELHAPAALLRNEDDLEAALARWTQAAGMIADTRPGTSIPEMAARAMREFEHKVRIHGSLERKALYRIACRIEDGLQANPA